MALLRPNPWGPLNLGAKEKNILAGTSKSYNFSSPRGIVSAASRFEQPQWLASEGEDNSLVYKVELVTDSSRNSSFTEPKGRIGLALIGENGKSALKYLPLEYDDSRELHFQSGDLDAFEFPGPDLGQLQALWIGPESGRWRLQEVRVTTFHDREEEKVYIFKGTGEVLGEGGDASAVELRPDNSKNLENGGVLREEGLKQYENLKKSLLVLDAVLVALGTGALQAAGLSEASRGFLVGGAGGFVYLFLLQRYVDRIGGSNRFEKPLFQLQLLLGVVALSLVAALKTFQADQLSGVELLGGAAGFLVVKVAILLAGTSGTE